MDMTLTRRAFLASTPLLLGCARALVPTPSVDDGDDDDMPPVPSACAAVATVANIEGPFYKPGAPSRTTLAAPSDSGVRLEIGGRVLSPRCEPIGGAVLDIWHADARGDYDLDTFRFRGTLTTDANGRWQLRSIVPGRYLNGRRYRPAHIHVKLRRDRFRPLTTQLYFAGDPYNDGDPFIDPSLIMNHHGDKALRRAAFDFVLAAA
jgi:protocatechuate 3,4-dioxygenase beta subunit